jgi:hypothetical protein
MEKPPEFRQFVSEASQEAVDFDGDEVGLAARARNGDETAVAELMRAYAALAVLTALRLQPTWLPASDAAQEAMIALQRLIEAGSTTIAVELPSVIQTTFGRLSKPPITIDHCSATDDTISWVDSMTSRIGRRSYRPS